MTMILLAQDLAFVLALIHQMHHRVNRIRLDTCILVAKSLAKGEYSLCIHVNKRGSIYIVT
jgi:hypothetical protein